MKTNAQTRIMNLALENELAIVAGSSRGIGAAIANGRLAYRRWLVAVVLAVTVVLAAGCSSTGTAVSVRLMTPVLTNQQAPRIEEGGWHQRFGGGGWYQEPLSPSFEIVR